MTQLGITCLKMGVSVWLALTLAFFLLRLLPGDAIQAQGIQAGLSSSAIEDRRQALGLHRPATEQYLHYLAQLGGGDLGVSLVTGESIKALLLTRGISTLKLAFGALFFAIGIGVFLGGVGGLSYHLLLSKIVRWLIDFLIAAPIYLTGTIGVMSGWIVGFWGAMVVLGLYAAAPLANTLSIALLSDSQQGHTVTAQAKGLPESIIFWRHRLRVVFHTLISVLTVQIGFLLGGTVITEAIFSQVGLGQSLVDAVLRRDYPVVQGWVLLMAVCQAVIYPTGKAINRIIDPRQRDESPL